MAEELKTVLGFEASQAIATLTKLDAQLAKYTKSMIAAANATKSYNIIAGQTKTRLAQLSSTQNRLIGVQNKLAASNKRVQKNFKDTSAAATAVGEKTKAASGQMLLSWQSIIRIFAIQTIHQAITKITSAFSGSIQEAMKLEIQLAEIQTIAPTLRNDFEGVADAVQQLSDQFGINREIVAEGIYQTLSNQVAQGAGAFTFFGAAADLSIGAVMSADSAVNLLSSTINSFGYSASQAATISGKLFKIIELGRVRGEEFANTFGRITVLASQLGISLDEIGASITTLTVTGLKYNEAATLITNTMLKLIKPTDALKDAYHAMGVETAEAGIQAYGFQGFLEKLRKSAGKSASAIGVLFGRVRAIRGVMGLTGEATEKYAKALEAISEAGAKDIFEAKQLIFETNAKQVEIEITRLKNAIVFDFGREALDVINNIFKYFGGAVNIMKSIAVAVGLAAVGLATFAAIVFPIPAMILAIATGIGFITLNILEANETAIEALEERMVTEKEAIDKINEAEGEAAEIRIRHIKALMAETQKFIIERNKGLNSIMETSMMAEKYIGDILHDQLKDRASAYDDFVDAIEDRIEQAATNITKSQKKIFDLQRMMDRASFDASVKGANDLTRSVVANQKATRLMNQAISAVREDKIERAEEYFTEAKSMVDMAVSSAEIAKNAGAEYQARQNLTRLYTSQIGMQKTIQKNEAQKARLAQKHYVEEKARADRIKTIIEALRGIRLFGKDGKIKFSTAEEAEAAVKPLLSSLEREFAEVGAKASIFKKLDLQKQLDDLMRPWEDAITRKPVTLRFAYEQYINETYKGVEEWFAANPIPVELEPDLKALGFKLDKLIGMREASEHAVELGKQLEKIERASSILPGKQKEHTNSIKNSRDAMYAFIDTITITKNELRKQRDLWQMSFDATPTEGAKKEIEKIEAELAGFVGQTKNVVPAMMQAMSATDKTFDPKKYELATTRLDIYAKKLEDVGETDAAKSIRILLGTVKATANIMTEIKLQPISPEEKATVDGYLNSLNEGFKKVQQEAGPNMSSAAATGAAGATTAAQSQINDQARIQSAIRQTLAMYAAIPSAAAAAQTAHFGKLMYRAVGGFAPQGTDTVPAMLSPGEFVVNAASTRKFFTQLVAINAGKKPVYREQGGPVTTIGDVNITVSGASAPKQTARETMLAFRREMRRRSATL